MHFDSGIMDAKHKLHKKQTTSFDYEKEMEQALSTIFRNLRGIEEIRFRITSNKGDVGHEMLQGIRSSSEWTCMESRRNLSVPLVKIEKENTGPEMLQGNTSKQSCIESRQDLSVPLMKIEKENTGPEMLQGSSSKPQSCIESRQDLSDLLGFQEHQTDEKNGVNLKCKRRLPVVPQTRGFSQWK